MIKAIRQFFAPKQAEKRDFSSFFDSASVEEKRKLMEDLARKANADQRALIEEYHRTNQKTAV